MSIKPIFAKKPTYNGSFFLLAMLAIGCLFLDTYTTWLRPLRVGSTLVASWLQLTVDYPQRVGEFIAALVSTKTNLVQDNIQLRYQQMVLEAKLQHFIALKAENSQLKALLQTTTQSQAKAIAARVLDVELSPVRQFLVLDKGWRDGVMINQAVLDARGVMGQIIDVGYMTSTVLLISDSKSGVPVRNHRTGEWGLVMGTNQSDALVLLNLPKTSPTQAGDIWVTSGLGGHYPEGYPVGTVLQLQRMAGEPFVQVAIAPIARLSQSQLVLVVLSDKKPNDLIDQIHTRLRVLSGMS